MTEPPLAPPPPPLTPSAAAPSPPRSRRRIAIAAAVIAALIVGAVVGVVIVSRPSGPPNAKATPTPSQASTQSGITTENQLLTAILTHGLTAQQAEELFALDVGPLPGVSVKGIKPDDAFDGSTALIYLYSEWTHLSKAQQAAAKRLVTSSRVQRETSSASAASHGDGPQPIASRTVSKLTFTSKPAAGVQLTDEDLFDYGQ